MRIKLSDILPNPKRDLKRNPLDKKKVAELVQSIAETGFWENVVVRKSPTQKGKYELAYGHHRWAAAVQAGVTEADFIVKDLSNKVMHQIMLRENNEVYGWSVAALLEAVRGAVLGLADGSFTEQDIVVPEKAKVAMRYAPSFVVGKLCLGDSPKHPYTISALARFLGKGYYEKQGTGDTIKATLPVTAAVTFLELVELGEIKESACEGLRLYKFIELVQKTVSDRKQRIRDEEVRQEQLKAKREQETKKLKEAENALGALQKRIEAVKQVEQEAVATGKKGKIEAYKEKLIELEQEKKKQEKIIATELPKIEAKLAAEEQRIEEEQKQKRKAEALRKEIDALIFTLEVIPSEKNAMRETLNRMYQTVQDTRQRERIRTALLNASVWLEEQCRRFVGPPPKPATGGDLIREANVREEAKRKRG